MRKKQSTNEKKRRLQTEREFSIIYTKKESQDVKYSTICRDYKAEKAGGVKNDRTIRQISRKKKNRKMDVYYADSIDSLVQWRQYWENS